MSQVSLALLGLPQVYCGGHSIRFRTRKALALLAYLATEGGMHSREKMAAFLWPDSPPEQGRTMLRTTLNYVRQAFIEVGGPAQEIPLVVERYALGFNLGADFDFDVHAVQATFDTARRAASTMPLPYAVIERLQAAVQLYRGDYLEGFVLDDAPEFEGWVSLQRETCRRWIESLFEWCSQTYSESDQIAQALEITARWVAHYPLNEAAHLRLMELHLAAGNRPAALKAYQSCKATLLAELDVEPASALRELAEKIESDQLQHRQRPYSPYEPKLPLIPIETPIVGRSNEHARLVAACNAVQDAGLQIVVVQGEAGIGKTSLVRAFLNWAIVQGADILQGRAFSASARLPFQLWTQALGNRLDRENAPDDLLGDVWLTELSRLVPDLRERYPDLPVAVADETTARTRLFEAVSRLGIALARKRQVVIALDDIQAADSDSLDLLTYVSQQWAERKSAILLILMTRPDNALAWLPSLPSNAVLRLTLSALTAEDTLELLLAVTQPESLEAQQIVRHFNDGLFLETQGQPFFIAETLKTLQERRLLTSQVLAGGQWRIDYTTMPIAMSALHGLMPDGVRTLIESRLAPLSQNAHAFLYVGAVLGHGFSFKWLCQIAAVSDNEGLAALDELLDGQLWRETMDMTAPPVLYFFTHDKIHEAIYARMSDARRKLYHRRAFTLLQTLSVSPAELAYHALGADLRTEAFHYSLVAGDDALRLYAIHSAIGHYQQALALYDLALGIGSTEQAAYLRIALGQAHFNLSAYKEAEHWYEDGLNAARANDNQTAIAQALRGLGSVQLAVGAYNNASRLFQESLQTSTTLGEKQIMAEALSGLGTACSSQGQYGEALDYYRQSLAIFRERDDRRGMATVLGRMGRTAAHQGSYAQAVQHLDESLALHRQIDNREGIAQTLASLGEIAGEQEGNYEKAGSFFEESLTLMRDIGNQTGTANALKWLGVVRAIASRYEDAFQCWSECLAIYRQTADPWGIALTLSHLGVVALLQGDALKALDYHQEALAINRSIGNLKGIAIDLHNLAGTELAQKHYAETKRYGQESAIIFEEIGERSGLASVLADVAMAATMLDEHQHALDLLRRALPMAVEIDAAPIILGVLVGFASLWSKQGRDREALTLVGLVMNHPAYSSDISFYTDPLAAELNNRLSREVVQASLETGKSMSLDTAIALVLENGM